MVSDSSFSPDTLLVSAGRDSEKFSGMVNTPVHRTSTILFPDFASYVAAGKGEAFYEASRKVKNHDHSYATTGTPSHFSLQQAIGTLEGGHTLLVPSGLSAITTALLAFVKQGDHILVSDSVYNPTRRFCDTMLKNLGVETTYYDPTIGAEIESLFRPNTRVLFTESPGSLTFEIQDIPLLTKIAHAKNALVILDNSWATPLYFQPLSHGVDVSVQAATKYIGGHSDVIMGTITGTDATIDRLLQSQRYLGVCVGADDCYLAERGLRSMAVRVRHHEHSSIELAQWLETRADVSRVLHPALPSHPQHALWKRDFKGSTGLFGVVLKRHYSFEELSKFIDGLELFGIGSSWGGFESLLIAIDPLRTAKPWKAEGSLLRIYTGLESTDDLKKDLDAGFARL